MKIKSIFLTKNLAEISAFQSFCSNNELNLSAQSYITFEPVSSIFRLPSQVYFFSSKNGVDFFRQQHVIEPNKKIACIGGATKNKLESLGYQVDFCGEEAGNPTLVGVQFLEWLEDRRVAFICSNISKKTISSCIPEDQKEEVIFYKTKMIPTKLEEVYDSYVFTSPSNVEAFLKYNTLEKNSFVIAWGKTTENALINQHIHVNLVLKSATFEELQNFLKEFNVKK